MPTAWNVHPKLSANSWEELADFAPVVDPETKVATVTLPVLFRGTRAQLLTEFKFGKQNAPHGGNGMFCLGPQDPAMVNYTEGDPHWRCNVSWAGVHSEISGSSATYAFSELPEWTTREFEVPIAIQPTGGGDTVYVAPGPPFTPNGTTGVGGLWRGRRIDHVPSRTITGVIFSSAEPTPLHPNVVALVNTFPDPPSGLLTNYGPLLADPTWVTFNGVGNQRQDAPGTPPASGQNPGAWVCRNFRINRHIAQPGAGRAAPALWFITGTWTYEQLRQPG